MAIGTPTERKAIVASAQGATTTFSPDTAITAGSVAILAATGNSNKLISSVTDSVGNTWTVHSTGGNGIITTGFASCQVATQIGTGDTITITWSTATSGLIDYWVQEVTGLATSSVFDVAAAGSNTGTAMLTADTATLAQADEIVFGLGRNSAADPVSWTKGSSYSNPTTPALGGSPGRRSVLEYKIVAATTAVNADGTWGASGTWVARVATFKGAASTLYQPGYGFGFL